MKRINIHTCTPQTLWRFEIFLDSHYAYKKIHSIRLLPNFKNSDLYIMYAGWNFVQKPFCGWRVARILKNEVFQFKTSQKLVTSVRLLYFIQQCFYARSFLLQDSASSWKLVSSIDGIRNGCNVPTLMVNNETRSAIPWRSVEVFLVIFLCCIRRSLEDFLTFITLTNRDRSLNIHFISSDTKLSLF